MITLENDWKNVVIDNLITCGICSRDHEDNPRQAVIDLLNWNIEVALDPRVSVDAQVLITSGAIESAKLILDKFRDIGSKSHYLFEDELETYIKNLEQVNEMNAKIASDNSDDNDA